MKMASRSIDLFSEKTNCKCSTLFFSNQQKNKFARACSTLFGFLWRSFAQLQRCFVGLNRQTSQLHIIFKEELSYVLTQYFVSCVHVRFYFSLPIIFTLLAAGISHCLTAALIFMFFFLQNSSLPFSITRSSSFSVIQVSVNIKNNVEKDTNLLFFLS